MEGRGSGAGGETEIGAGAPPAPRVPHCVDGGCQGQRQESCRGGRPEGRGGVEEGRLQRGAGRAPEEGGERAAGRRGGLEGGRGDAREGRGEKEEKGRARGGPRAGKSREGAQGRGEGPGGAEREEAPGAEGQRRGGAEGQRGGGRACHSSGRGWTAGSPTALPCGACGPRARWQVRSLRRDPSRHVQMGQQGASQAPEGARHRGDRGQALRGRGAA
mmetsp:Transcript_85690/g.250900  ORF Transcript_85690/g.250900 Transcript_85690/m.250900 type:complete len:217 (-) Transcript_85690:1122-1772(-)